MSASSPTYVKFLPWFSIAVEHGYYKDGRCPDLQITPDDATSALLKGLKASVKASSSELRVALPGNADGSTPLIPPPTGAILGFWLLARTATFREITSLPESADGQCPCWESSGDDSKEQVLTAGTTALPQWAARAGATLVGRVALSSFTTEAKFSVVLQAGKSTWTYYLLDSKNPTSYALADKSSRLGTDKLQFSAFEVQDPPPPWLATLQNGGSKLWLFQSQATDVPWRQEGYRSLTLERDEATVIQNLPNPAPGGTGAVLLNLAKVTPASPA